MKKKLYLKVPARAGAFTKGENSEYFESGTTRCSFLRASHGSRTDCYPPGDIREMYLEKTSVFFFFLTLDNLVGELRFHQSSREIEREREREREDEVFLVFARRSSFIPRKNPFNFQN